MKKKLNIEGITSELEGASAFFTRPTPGVGKSSSATEPITILPSTRAATPPPTSPTAPPPHDPTDNTVPQQTNRQASMLASYQTSVVETIRKTVKEVGKEISFVRLTLEEKRQLAD